MHIRMRFKKTGKPRRDVFFRYRGCFEKSRFRHLRDAVQAADRYMERVPVTRAPMVPYYCPAHSCWHIGHDRKMSVELARTYEANCIRRQRLREEIKHLSSASRLLEPVRGRSPS